jgi:hypothetical protein
MIICYFIRFIAVKVSQIEEMPLKFLIFDNQNTCMVRFPKPRLVSGLIIVVVALALAGTVRGQYGSFGLTDARQLALGNTYVTNSRELYAAGKNPSLLAERYSDRKLDILFPALSARAYNVTKVADFFNDFFSRRPVDIITSLDGSVLKQALGNEGKLYLGLQIGFLGVAYTQSEKVGSFSFAMKDYLTGSIKLPQGIVDFSSGSGYFSKSVILTDFRFTSSWTRAYELSYGRVFHTDASNGIIDVYTGIGVKFISGFMYRDVQFSAGAGYQDENGVLTGTYNAISKSAFSDDIHTDNLFNGEDIITNIPFMQSVGKGFAMDLGATLLLEPGIKFAMSITDAGFIDWRGKTKSTFVSGMIKLDSNITIDDIDSLANLVVIDHETASSFRTQPSTALHFGYCFLIDRYFNNFPGKMNVALEIHQALNSNVENPSSPRLAAGLDWKPGKWWPVFLTGVTNNRTNSIDWSVGLGYELKFMELYISTPDFIPVLEGNSLQTMSLSLCWHFVKSR